MDSKGRFSLFIFYFILIELIRSQLAFFTRLVKKATLTSRLFSSFIYFIYLIASIFVSIINWSNGASARSWLIVRVIAWFKDVQIRWLTRRRPQDKISHRLPTVVYIRVYCTTLWTWAVARLGWPSLHRCWRSHWFPGPCQGCTRETPALLQSPTTSLLFLNSLP